LTEGNDMMETNVDRLIQYAMQEFPEGTTDEELEFYRQTKPILRDEILTCYQYLEEKGLLDDYRSYRG